MSANRISCLIIAPSWVGDAVMSISFVDRLHARHPDWAIDVFAPAWVAPVYRRARGIRRIIDNPFGHGQLRLRHRYQSARTLAKEHYGKAYVLPNSLKSALIPWLAGIPERVGYTGESRYGLINCRHRLDPQATPLMVERFVALATPPGPPSPTDFTYPVLDSSPEQQSLALKSIGQSRPAKLMVLCPGAEFGPAKRWPAEYYAQLAQNFVRRGFSVWLLGSPKDNAVGEEIALKSEHAAINFCGKTGLEQAIDLIALADIVVTNDSGLMHVSCALGRPVVALFGSSSPHFTPPLSDRSIVLRSDEPCSPCFKRQCPLPVEQSLKCLHTLGVEHVENACLSLLP